MDGEVLAVRVSGRLAVEYWRRANIDWRGLDARNVKNQDLTPNTAMPPNTERRMG